MYRPASLNADWKNTWFYVGNHYPSLPEQVPGPPKVCDEWSNAGPGGEQVNQLLGSIIALKSSGVTGGSVVYSWMNRRVQPQQKREHPGFFEVVQAAWSKPINRTDIASVLSAKFKALSYDLKYWSKKLSNLSLLIDKCNKIIFFMDCLEECRDLTISEWNFRVVMKIHLSTLLKYKKLYWQKKAHCE